MAVQNLWNQKDSRIIADAPMKMMNRGTATPFFMVSSPPGVNMTQAILTMTDRWAIVAGKGEGILRSFLVSCCWTSKSQ